MRATRARSSRISSCRTGWCDHGVRRGFGPGAPGCDADRRAGQSAAGLLGAAAEIGTPVAVIVGDEKLAADAGALGAASVLVVAPVAGELTVPVVDALAAAADLVRPDAILISNSIEGRDVAGRFAARTRSGLCVDAVGVSRDAEGVVAQHSVYGGAYNVDAAVTWGAPVITVRQGAVEARAAAVAEPTCRALAVTASGKRARGGCGGAGRGDVVAAGAARREGGRLGRPGAGVGGEVRARR